MFDDRVSGDVDVGGSGHRGLAASSGTLDVPCRGIARYVDEGVLSNSAVVRSAGEDGGFFESDLASDEKRVVAV